MQKVESGGAITVPVPDHRELRTGTLMSIIRQAGLPRALFDGQLHLTPSAGLGAELNWGLLRRVDVCVVFHDSGADTYLRDTPGLPAERGMLVSIND